MDAMPCLENQQFPIPFYQLVCYRLQPKGINQYFGAKDEPLSPPGDLGLIPKYINSWMEDTFEVDVSHGHERTLRIPLQKVSYNSGDHTSYKLIDLDTGELVTIPCAPYAIHNVTVYKARLREYIHDTSFTVFALASEPKFDEYLASKFHSILESGPISVSRQRGALAFAADFIL
jgi:hypothetical protein